MSNTLPLYTVPSTWVGKDCAPFPTPYDRIIAIKSPDGSVLRTGRPSYKDPGAGFSLDDITRIEIPTNPVLSERIAAFAQTCLIGASPDSFNCHQFSSWVNSGKQTASPLHQHTKIVDAPKLNSPATGLALGQRGFVGRMLYDTPKVLHSMIGLGEDNPQCIQIMANGGYLALTTYDEQVAYFTQLALGKSDSTIATHPYGVFAGELFQE